MALGTRPIERVPGTRYPGSEQGRYEICLPGVNLIPRFRFNQSTETPLMCSTVTLTLTEREAHDAGRTVRRTVLPAHDAWRESTSYAGRWGGTVSLHLSCVACFVFDWIYDDARIFYYGINRKKLYKKEEERRSSNQKFWGRNRNIIFLYV
jgi:hypothetical protein